MNIQLKPILLFIVFALLAFQIPAQIKKLSGVVRDKQSEEPIPFASVSFKNSHKGVLTDSAGRFSFDLSTVLSNDSMIIQSVGYKL